MKLASISIIVSILSLTLYSYSPARTSLGTFITSKQETLWSEGLVGVEIGAVELLNGISTISVSSEYAEDSSGSNEPNIFLGIALGTLLGGTTGAYIGYTTYNQQGIGRIGPTITGGVIGAVAGGIIGYGIALFSRDKEEYGTMQEPLEERSVVINDFPYDEYGYNPQFGLN